MEVKKGVNRSFEEANTIALTARVLAFKRLVSRLDLLNDLLIQYAEEIKSMQKISHGSLVPHFQVCSASGCLGCLHVRWKKWFDPQKEQRKRQRLFGKKVGEKDVKSRFIARDIKTPLQNLPRGEEFAELRQVVKSFEEVKRRRGLLVKHISDALKASASIDL